MMIPVEISPFRASERHQEVEDSDQISHENMVDGPL